MSVIEFKLPTKIIFGANSLDSLSKTIKQYGSRAVIVTDGGSFNQIGLIDQIVKKLNDDFINVIVYSDINSKSTSDDADIIANLIRYSKANCIVSIGGFKVQNIAKGAGVVVSNSGEASDYVNGQPVYHTPIPIISVPTIFGCLSEINQGMYLFDKYDNILKESTDKNILVKDCIIDPLLYATIPVKYFMSSALSVFALAFDAYMSTSLNIMNDPIVKHSMGMSINSINKLMLNSSDTENISNMAMANILCGITTSNGSFGAIRALSIAVSSIYSVNKSIVSTIMLPHIMEYYITVVPDKYTILADIIDDIDPEMTPFEIASQGGTYIKRILQNINLPTRLNEINIDRSKFNKVAELALTYSGMNELPRAMNYESLITLLEQAY